MYISADILEKDKKILFKKTQSRFGDTYRRTRDATCARRRRVASSRRSRTRRVEPQLRASEQAGQMGGVGRHFDGVGHTPLLAHRLESCPPDGRDARARQEPVWRPPTTRRRYRDRSINDHRHLPLSPSRLPFPSRLFSFYAHNRTRPSRMVSPDDENGFRGAFYGFLSYYFLWGDVH